MTAVPAGDAAPIAILSRESSLSSESSMSESASPKRESRPQVTELNVSGHLMTLEAGLFCILQTGAAEAGHGPRGVRLSVPPGGEAAGVQISSFRPDGWLSGPADAALVRVARGPAQLLVTVHQGLAGEQAAPKLQVLRLAEATAAPTPTRAPAPALAPALAQAAVPVRAAPAAGGRTLMDMAAHIQGRGDVGALLGDWLGERGSKAWIEGFAVSPSKGVPPQDIEYQAVLGRGWLSPWAEGGQFCGSRGMALPLLGLRLRLRGTSAETHECHYSATFTDGSTIGPVAAGEACEAESLAPLEAFMIEIRPREPRAAPAAARPVGRKPAAARPAAKPAARPAAKPAPAKPAAPRRGRAR